MRDVNWNDEAEVDALILRYLLDTTELPVLEEDEILPYSRKYKRWERRFLADPFRRAEMESRNIWQSALQTAVKIILTMAIILCALIVVNDNVRAAVIRWFME